MIEQLEPRLFLDGTPGFTFSEANKTSVSTGLSALTSTISGMDSEDALGSQTLAFLGQTMSGLFNSDAQILDGIITPSQEYFSGEDPLTPQGWADYLAQYNSERLGVNAALSNITVPTLEEGATDGYITFTYHSDLDIGNKLLDWDSLVGELDLSMLGFSAGMGNAGLDIYGSVDWTVTLGVDSTGFYLQPGDVTISAFMEGGVSISLQAGMFSLHTGTFTGTGPSASVSFSDPNGDGKLRTSELPLTSLSASYDTTNYSLSVPVNFDDASMALAEDASLIFSRADSADSAFDLTGGSNLSTLLRTVSLNPQMIVDSLYRLQLSMQSLNSAEALRFTLPLTQGIMPRDVIDFADGIAEGLNDALMNLVEIEIDGGGTSTEVQPAFTTWTQLQSALSDITSALDFDPATREIVFSLDYEYDFPSIDIPLDFSVDFSPLSLSSDSEISLTGSASYGFDLGMQLAPNEQLMVVASQASVDSDDPATVSNCYNPGLLQFDIAINLDDSKTFTVNVLASGNSSMFDLVDDINSALLSSGASGYVEAVLFDASALGRVVTRDDIGEIGYEGTGRIGFRTIADTDWLLQVDVSTLNNAYSVLGFTEHESKSPGLATFFIDNASVGATVGLQGTFDATASLGIVSLELPTATVDISGSASSGLVNPVEGGTRIEILDLLQYANRWSEMVSLSFSGSGNMIFDNINVPGLSGVTQGASPEIRLVVSDITDPRNIDVQYTDLGNLTNIGAMSVSDVLGTLASGVDFLSGLDGLDFLDFTIPLVNMNIVETLDMASDFASKVESAEATADEGGSLQLLSGNIGEVFGLGESGPNFTLSLDGWNLKLDLDYDIAFDKTLPFSLNLASLIDMIGDGVDTSAFDMLSSIVDVGGSTELALSASAGVHLALGLDISDAENLRTFVYDESNLTLSADATANDINFDVAFGSLGMFIKGGSASLGSAFVVQLVDDGDGRHYFSDMAALRQDIDTALTGTASVDLPVYFPTDSMPIGGVGNNSIVLDIPDLLDLATKMDGGTVLGEVLAITTPDFSNLFTGLNIIQVLNNPSVVIDGIQGAFDMVQNSVNAVVTNIQLPLVGDYLIDAVGFAGDLGDSLLEYVRTTMNQVLDGQSPPELLQSALYSAFGPGGLGVLEDSTGDGQVTLDDVVLTVDDTNWEYIEYNMQIGQTLLATGVEFDLGIDGVPLSLDGEVAVEIGWGWDFGFGIDVTDGFYLVDSGENEMSIDVDVTMPQTLTGKMFFLEATVDPLDGGGSIDYDHSLLHGDFHVDFVDPGADGKITIAEIRGYAVRDLITAGFTGLLDANFQTIFSFGGSTQFPRVKAVIELDWEYTKNFGQDTVSNPLSVEFSSVAIDLGTFVSGFLDPVFGKIDEVLDPIRPILDFIQQDLPVLDLSLLDIARVVGGYDARVKSAVMLCDTVIWISDMSAQIAALSGSGECWIDMGSFSLGDPTSEDASIQQGSMPDLTSSLNGSSATEAMKSLITQANTAELSPDPEVGGGNRQLEFSLDILEPATIFQLIMGKQVTLFSFAMPQANFAVGYSYFQPIFGPLGLRLGGEIGVNINLGIGYDTYGIQRAMDTGNYANIIDGLYISDRENADGTGLDVPEVSAYIDLYAAGELNAVIAKGGVKGGITGTISLNLNDPNDDGKVRMSELWGNMMQGPQYVFDASLIVEAYVSWYVTIGIGPFSKTFDGKLAEVTLLDESWSASSEPILVSESSPGNLTLNMGDFAEDRLHGNKTTGSESFVLTSAGAGSMSVSYGGVSQTISYSPGDTILVEAGPGDDSLIIGAGVDVNVIFDGGTGNDYVEMQGSGWLEAHGGAGNDTIIGGSGNDRLFGDDGNDIINGGTGTNTIEGGAGNDTLNGGSGADTFVFGPGFGTDTINDAGGTDTADFTAMISPVTTNTMTARVSSEEGDSVTLNAVPETIIGGQGSDTILGQNVSNTWHITQGDGGAYNTMFDFQSFERLIGNAAKDAFVFDDAAYISHFIDGGSGAEDSDDADYATLVNADIIDLSAYTTSNRWQVSQVDAGRLFLAYASPEFVNVENHSGGSARDYLVLSDDSYVSGMFDGNGEEDRIEISDYKLTDVYKKNVWDFTGYNSGSVNERTAFVECENFTGGNNEDTFYIHPAGAYAAGFLFTPGGTGGIVNGTIDAQGENDTINNSPSYRVPTMSIIPAAIVLPVETEVVSDMPPLLANDPAGETRVNGADYDVIWHITGNNSGTRTANGGTVEFSSTQNLDGASGRDLFIIHPGGSLDGYIDGHGGDDAIIYGWEEDVWSSQVSVDFLTATEAEATAIGGYIDNIESLIAGTNTNDSLIGADIANFWSITDVNTGNIGGVANVAFLGFENIAGGTSTDNFSFAAGSIIDGSVGGGGGEDIIDMSSFGSAITWNVSGTNSGTISLDGGDPTAFTGIESVTGGTGADDFIFGASGELTGTIQGNSGTDKLDYGNVSADMTFSINAQGAGEILRNGGTTLFSGVENIDSGSGDDRYAFADGMGIDGQVDAGAGSDTFDYSDYNVISPVVVNLETLQATGLGSFANAENFVGGASMSNQLIGKDGVTSVWTISDWDDGSIAIDAVPSYVFFDFQNLIGGSGNDTFNFADTKYVHGPISGGGGTDSMSFAGYTLNQTWTITAANAGRLFMTETRDPVSLLFSNIENVRTGDANNTITFQDGTTLERLETGDGRDEVSLAAYTTPVTVNLQAESMTPAGYFDTAKTDKITGSAVSDTLIAKDGQANTWALTTLNGGTVNVTESHTLEFASMENLTGGTGDDTFVFSGSGGVSGDIQAMGESTGNSLDYSAISEAVTVDLHQTTGSRIGGEWSNIRNFTGGAGSDTLIGINVDNTWDITGINAGNVNSHQANFDGFENLTGGTAQDSFIFADGAGVAGVVDGQAGDNTLDYSAYTTAVAMNLQEKTATSTGGFDNIQNYSGGSSTGDSLTGANVTSEWTISADNGGTITDQLDFDGVENLSGGTVDDEFIFADGRSITGTLSGGAGTDLLNYTQQTSAITTNLQTGETSLTGGFDGIDVLHGSADTGDELIGWDAANTWNVTENNGGNVTDGTNSLDFRFIDNLTGGSGADSFVLSDGVGVSGSIAGRAGADVLDLSDFTTGRTFQINGSNLGSAGSQAFEQVESLVGTQSDDTFDFADGATLEGTIDAQAGTDTLDYASYTTAITVNRQTQATTGTAGYDSIEAVVGSQTETDTLIGQDAAATWTVESANAGNVDGTFTFASMENLTGGTNDDTFAFEAGSSLAGSVAASAGDDTLDYSAFNSQVTIDMENQTATGIALGYTGVENFVGSNQNDTLVGTDATTTWNVTDNNAGNVNETTTFSSFENLTGGSGDDTVVFADGKTLAGSVNTGLGSDTLDYSAYTTGVTVNVQTASATGIGGTYSNVETVVGSSTETDTLVGPNVETTWRVTAEDTGTVGALAFESFGNLVGGTADDTFALVNDGAVTGSIDGQAGTDSFDYTASNRELALNLRDNSAGGVPLFSSIERFDGSVAEGVGENVVIGPDADTTWLVHVDGTIENQATGQLFSNVDSLQAGSGNDTFIFDDGTSLGGEVDAGDGQDTFDFSAYTTPISVDLATLTTTATPQGLASIETIIGGSANDTVTGDNVDTTWNITGLNQFNVGGVLACESFEIINGGSANDTFVFSDAAGVEGLVDAGDGSDTFDYSAYTTDVQVDLGQKTATGTGGYDNVESFIGGSGSNRMTATDAVNDWQITDDDAGTINGTTAFAAFGSLWGGELTDTFTFADGVVVSSDLNGGEGMDMLDFSNYTTYNTWTSPEDGVVQIETNFGTFIYRSIEDYQGGSSVFLFSSQDLRGSFLNVNLPPLIVPGESTSVTVRVSNLSNVPFKDRTDIAVYASVDQQLDEGDLRVGFLSQYYVWASQNHSTDCTVTIRTPQDMTFGDYYLILKVDDGDEVEEVDENNNIAVLDEQAHVVPGFGNVGVGRNAPLVLELADGTNMTLRLTGPGRAEVTGDADSGFSLELFDTTAGSTLKITVDNSDTNSAILNDILVHGDLKAILASVCDLQGDLTVEGSLGQLVMDDILPGQTNAVTIGQGQGQSLRVTLDEIVDAQIDSGTAVSRFAVSSWQDVDETVDLLSANNFSQINIAGGMQADIQSDADITKIQAETLTGEVQAGGKIDTVLVTGGGLANNLQTGGNLRYLRVAGPVAGNVTVGGKLSSMVVQQGGITGDVEVTGDFRKLQFEGDLAGSMTVGGNVDQIYSGAGSILGDVDITGRLDKLYLKEGDVAGNIDVGEHINKVRLDQLSGIVRSGSYTRSFRVDGGFTGELFSFDWIGSVLVYGGDMDGKVGTNTKLYKLRVIGNDGVGGGMNGIVEAGDHIYALSATAACTNARIHAALISTIYIKGGFTGQIIADGVAEDFPRLAAVPNLRKLVVRNGDLAGTVTAGNAALIYVANGDMLADVTTTDYLRKLYVVSGSSTGAVDVGGDLGVAYIRENVSGQWTIDGSAKKIYVRGEADGWQLQTGAAGTKVTSLVVGEATDLEVTGQSDFRLVKTHDWLAGQLQANSVRKLVTYGNHQADVTLTGAGLAGRQKVLSVAYVLRGSLLNSDWQVTGNVGKFVATTEMQNSSFIASGNIGLVKVRYGNNAVVSAGLAVTALDEDGVHVGEVVNADAKISRAIFGPSRRSGFAEGLAGNEITLAAPSFGKVLMYEVGDLGQADGTSIWLADADSISVFYSRNTVNPEMSGLYRRGRDLTGVAQQALKPFEKI